MKKIRNGNKYTELLQVTEDGVTKSTTASVKKLRAKNLSEFIESSSNSVVKPQSLTKDRNQPPPLPYDTNDEIPIIFVGKRMDKFTKGKLSPDFVQRIMESYYHEREQGVPEDEAALAELLAKREFDEIEATDALKTTKSIADGGAGDVNSNSPTEFSTNETLRRFNKDSHYHSHTHRNAEQDAQAKKFCVTTNLSSYLDLCVSTGMLNRGLATVLNYRHRYKKVSSTFLSIGLYNILLHGFAGNGQLEKVREILGILHKDHIPLDHQSYAAVLETIGRVTETGTDVEDNHLTFLRSHLATADAQGISLNDIVTKSVFVRDQYATVLSVARALQPTFEPQFQPPNVFYNNPLLTSLNEHVHPADSPTDPLFNRSSSRHFTETSKRKNKSFSRESLHAMMNEQLQAELSGHVTVRSIEKFPPVTEAVLLYRQRLDELQELWKAQICAAFNRDLKTLQAQTNSKMVRTINLLPYLRAMDASQYAEILLREVRRLGEGSETYSPTVGQLYRQLGLTVQQRYHLEQSRENGVQEKVVAVYDKYLEYAVINRDGSSAADNGRQIWQKLGHRETATEGGASLRWTETQWPQYVTIGVGRFLYNILMRDLKVDTNVTKGGGGGGGGSSKKISPHLSPAFYTIYRNQARAVKEEVKPHPVLVKLFRESQQEHLTFATSLVPMLCPPLPWTSPISGGYLVTRSDLIRLPQHANQQLLRVQESPAESLYPSFDSLNQLAAVPWVVNQQILDVVLEVFNNDGSDALDVPRPPSTLPRPQSAAKLVKKQNPETSTENDGDEKQKHELTGAEKMQLFREKLQHSQKQAEMYSLWCDCLYRLSLANHFRDRIFWLPHNMDFRGRVYPLPPHLNHLGSDLARSMLLFQERRPLGPDGYRWLKLHCINLTGLKKRSSVEERLEYAEEIFESILDSAARPLTGQMWWSKSDEPWQTLACCMEIARVQREVDEGGRGGGGGKTAADVLSNFPIHQDGSCNGLQHYAALGRDAAGAFSVNLAPSPIPQDVYSAVAALVDETRARDAERGEEVAKVLAGHVKRKVIKQTVMTTVYGVTRFGARLQIAKQLKNIGTFPPEFVWPASTYLTSRTFESLGEMFTSTKEIQDWFTDCARLIATVCAQNVEWVTPLGLPVVQPYNRFVKRTLPKSNAVQERFSVDTFERPNIVKQKNAFPPNFIHSLDSSHMMLTSLHCERERMTFISVHDCFWTHAATVPVMNRVCREQFVALHEMPILEELSRFLQDKYCFSER